MLQEAIDLQQRAVSQLFTLSEKSNDPLTFKAPTGSGKTRMMADFMNKVLSLHDDVVFLVSSLSKGDLAEQNYESFEKCKEDGTFPYLKSYLINTEVSGEENLFIPTDYNIYVLPRDLYKNGGKLMKGIMDSFLTTMTEYYFGEGLNKRIYLIKDECHIATNNLDSLSEKYFTKIFNFSATPKLRRGQIPDVEITDAEAVQAKLIKRVEYGLDSDSLEDAICKFEEIKKKYLSLGVNPCLIIQISNKDKAEEEWNSRIKPILDKAEHQSLKWMLIVDKPKDCDTNDAIKKKLSVNQWKKYAKGNASTIDVIVFKMVISEGWDIPRACMLYQVRDTQSKQLDEQVMGRVRRNPRLKDYETLSEKEKELATTAWIWGIKPESANKQHEVTLFADGKYVAENIRLKTIKLQNLIEKNDFDLNGLLANKQDEITHESIFTLYQRLIRSDNELQAMCYRYADNDVSKWLKYMESFDDIKRHYKTYVCDYEQSMVIDKEVSFPISSFYVDNGNVNEIYNWVWCRKDNQPSYSFDSEAERRWASLLQELNREYGSKIEMEDKKFLWGKNFPYNSEIKYEYYNDGIHASYPDFVMKDSKGIIHVFEVKSVNISKLSNINGEEYKDKIRHLEKCYQACSRKLPNIYFYFPILQGDKWQIVRFRKGEKDVINKEEFKESLKG